MWRSRARGRRSSGAAAIVTALQPREIRPRAPLRLNSLQHRRRHCTTVGEPLPHVHRVRLQWQFAQRAAGEAIGHGGCLP